MSKLRLHEPKFTIPAPTTGIRFVRRAQRHVGIAPSRESLASSSEICVSLYRLGSNARKQFEEAKDLRSRNTPLAALYLRARLFKFVDEPWQTRARKYLQNVLRYRKGDIPPRNTSLILLPAAHDLRTEVRLLIRDIARVERCNFPPPLHLPSDKLILKKGQPLTQQVFNYRSFMKNWSRNASVKCTSINFRSGCKTTAIISGHLMCAAADVIPHSCLATANLADTTYFSSNKWRAATLRVCRIGTNIGSFPLRYLNDYQGG